MPTTVDQEIRKNPAVKSRATPAPVAAGPEAFKQAILHHLKHTLARDPGTATVRDWWISTAMAVRDCILERFIATQGVHNDGNVRRVYYLSLEYLMGRLLESNLHNTGLYDDAVAAVARTRA